MIYVANPVSITKLTNFANKTDYLQKTMTHKLKQILIYFIV